MRTELLALDPSTYRPHPLHASDRVWSETNCYVDLWIELLHALGLEPAAAGAFALASDFLDDQWTFFKHPPEDLRRLYGIDVGELTVWRTMPDHVQEHLARGRLLTVEVDAWHLPDTAGVSYGCDHVKTTIVPQMIDPDAVRLGYFHNSGYYELSGDDYTALMEPPPGTLPPYVELVRLDAARPDPGALLGTARDLAREHLRRRPPDNPVTRYAARLQADLRWLTGAGMDEFHRYAFATCRQCGAAAEVAASFVEWLRGAAAADGDLDVGGGAREAAAAAVAALTDLAGAAKVLELMLARAAAGRAVDLGDLLGRMAGHWDDATAALGGVL